MKKVNQCAYIIEEATVVYLVEYLLMYGYEVERHIYHYGLSISTSQYMGNETKRDRNKF